MIKSFLVKLIERKKINKDIYKIYFNRPDDFNFLAGQYIRIIAPHANTDEKGSSRFFTISSTPLDKYIMITTKFRKSSFKKALLSLKTGDYVRIFGPMGRLYLNHKSKKPIVFLSGGMGITPFYSILSHIHRTKIILNITLIASFNDKKDLIFVKNLKEIALENKSIQVHFTITKINMNKINSDDEFGRISQNMILKYISDYRHSKFYVTGPQSMVDSIVQLLRDLDIREKYIYTESFTGY